jgi:hypothetical protein
MLPRALRSSLLARHQGSSCGHQHAWRLLRRTRVSYFYNVFPPFCSWAHMSGLNILVRAPLKL